MIKCSWPECKAETETPGRDLWRLLADYPPPIADGLYCPTHADAIEAEVFPETEGAAV
jgi:hypothetical protein